MIGIPPGVRILIAMQPVDFRRGADSLAALAKEALQQDPFSGTVLVFRAKRADRVKVVAWDGSGLVMLWKRLDEGAFKWPPPVRDGVMRLSSAQLAALLEGLDWSRVHALRRHRPTAVR
jgi:transposase